MSKTFEQVWDEVEVELANAKGIAFDGCHKIYVAFDHQQNHLMAGYGYGHDEGTHLITISSTTPAEMLTTLKKWYGDSCALRFIQGVETNEENPNAGFSDLIPQGYESEFCSLCGEFGADFDGYCEDCREEDEEEDEDEDEDEDE